MAHNYFPLTKHLAPTFWAPEYDPIPPVKGVSIKTFNKDTYFSASNDVTGIISGRNYGSFNGYIDMKTAAKILEVIKAEKVNLESDRRDDDLPGDGSSPLIVYDLFGHSSGLPLIFLKNKAVGLYISYSVQNDQMRYQLIRNAKAYGFASKLIVLSDLNEVISFEKGSIAIIPPKLQTLGLTAEDFLNFNRDNIWIAIVVATEVKEAVHGFELKEFEEFKVYINERNTPRQQALETKRTIDRLKACISNLASNKKVPDYVGNFYDDSYLIKGIPLKDLPIATYDVEKIKLGVYDMQKALTPEWLKTFKSFLTELLKKLDVNDPKKLITDDFLKKYWIRAFVHEVVNAENNYESLETIGDAALGYAFKEMLFQYNPKISPAQLTNIYMKYLSKKKFSGYSRDLSLPLFAILGPIEMTTDISEDIFEAFAGAIVLVGDTYEDGLGMLLIRRFIRLVMYHELFLAPDAKERLNDDMIKNKFTLINDYKSIIGADAFVGSMKTTGDRAIFTLSITEKGYSKLKKLGFKIASLPKQYISEDTEPSIARDYAYEKLYHSLKNIGFTNDFYEEYKTRKKREHTEALYEKYSLADKIARKKGFDHVTVKVSSTASTHEKTVLILLGHKADGKISNLKIIVHKNNPGNVSEVNRHLATNKILEDFINEN